LVAVPAARRSAAAQAKAALDEWCKHVAPSDELRKWYGHEPGRFEEFGRRYRLELQNPTQAEALVHLRALAKDRQLTLLTATRQPEISEAAVLATLLQSQHGTGSLTPAMAGLRQAAFLFAHATPHPVDLMCPQRKRQAFTPDPAPGANSLRLRLLCRGLAG
jgi:uncharacterized protein YeaO (DUF488 family)